MKNRPRESKDKGKLYSFGGSVCHNSVFSAKHGISSRQTDASGAALTHAGNGGLWMTCSVQLAAGAWWVLTDPRKAFAECNCNLKPCSSFSPPPGWLMSIGSKEASVGIRKPATMCIFA